MSERFSSFEEFWPHYVRAHANKTNRRLHFVGTTAGALVFAAGLITRKKRYLALAPAIGYGFAWVGHFMFERNIPATFNNPLWSFKADWLMWLKTVKGEMDAEVASVLENGHGVVQPSAPDPNLN